MFFGFCGGGRGWWYKEFKTFILDDGVMRKSDVPNHFLFYSFLRLLRAYMPMRAKWEVHRLSWYLIEGAVWGATPPPPPPPPSTQNLFLLLVLLPASPLSVSTLNRQLPEYRSLSISELLQPIPIISKLTWFVICSVLTR